MYRSNNGAGPDEARVVRVVDGTAHMERRRIGGRTWTRFKVRAAFLSSPACGWKKVVRA